MNDSTNVRTGMIGKGLKCPACGYAGGGKVYASHRDGSFTVQCNECKKYWHTRGAGLDPTPRLIRHLNVHASILRAETKAATAASRKKRRDSLIESLRFWRNKK